MPAITPHSSAPPQHPVLLAMEYVPDAIVVVDAAGAVVAANTLACELFGYALGDLIRQPVEALVPERTRASHRLRRAEYARDPQPRALRGVIGVRSDGAEFHADISLCALDVDGRSLVVSAIRQQHSSTAAQQHSSTAAQQHSSTAAQQRA